VLRPKLAVDAFWADVREHGCTSTTIGAVIGLLLDRPARADDRDHPLRFVFFGKVGTDGWKFIERFGLHALSCYGSTEVGFPIVNRHIEAGTVDVAGWLRRGYHARVVDDDGKEVANGTTGELWIEPPDRRLMLREYLNQPELTARTVVDGWYRTGDAVRRRDDGGFEFVDRMRDTIRRFGENISSSALENAVLGDDEVLECAAVGVPSPVTGQEVLLLVVPRPGRTIDAGALAARLRAVLPRYMNPAYIAVLDELPKTPNGKVRKVGLAGATDLDHVWKAAR
jgi:crotonobetaine/carnitine-CoA ligase